MNIEPYVRSIREWRVRSAAVRGFVPPPPDCVVTQEGERIKVRCDGGHLSVFDARVLIGVLQEAIDAVEGT